MPCLQLPQELLIRVIEDVFGAAIHEVLLHNPVAQGPEGCEMVLALLHVNSLFRETILRLLIRVMTDHSLSEDLALDRPELDLLSALCRLWLLKSVYRIELERSTTREAAWASARLQDPNIASVPICRIYDFISDHKAAIELHKTRGALYDVSDILKEMLSDHTNAGMYISPLGQLKQIPIPWDELKVFQRPRSMASVLRRPCRVALQLNLEARLYRCVQAVTIVFLWAGKMFEHISQAGMDLDYVASASPVGRLGLLCDACKIAIAQLAREWKDLCDVIPIGVPDEKAVISLDLIQEICLNYALDVLMGCKDTVDKMSASHGTPTFDVLMSLMDEVTKAFDTNCLRTLVQNSTPGSS